MRLLLERWASPISSLLLVTDDEGALRALEFAENETRMRGLFQRYYGDYTLEDGAAPDSLKRALQGIVAEFESATSVDRTSPSGTRA